MAGRTEAFNPAGFLELASSLARRNRANQAELRSAISRAYYSVFLYARERLMAAGRISPTGSPTDHGLVVERLRSLGGPQGDQVDKLRKRRNQADYNLRQYVTRGKARQAVTVAESLWPRL